MFADSDHDLNDIWTEVTPGMPFAILLTLLLAMAIFKASLRCLEKCLGSDFYSKRLEPRQIESLEPFYQALSQKQLSAFLKEETICRDKLGFKRLTNESYGSLATASTQRAVAAQFGVKQKDEGTKCMEGVHNYNILSNQMWYDKYMYIPYNVDHEERLLRCVSMYKDPDVKLLSLDVVRCASDLAYIPRGEAKDMKFDVKYLKQRTGKGKQGGDLEQSIVVGTPMQ